MDPRYWFAFVPFASLLGLVIYFNIKSYGKSRTQPLRLVTTCLLAPAVILGLFANAYNPSFWPSFLGTIFIFIVSLIDYLFHRARE